MLCFGVPSHHSSRGETVSDPPMRLTACTQPTTRRLLCYYAGATRRVRHGVDPPFLIPRNNFCEAAIRVKQILYPPPSSLKHTSPLQRVLRQTSVRALRGRSVSRPAH